MSQDEFLLLVLPADSLDSCRKLGGPSGGDDRPSSARVCMSGRDCVSTDRERRGEEREGKGERERKRESGEREEKKRMKLGVRSVV